MYKHLLASGLVAATLLAPGLASAQSNPPSVQPVFGNGQPPQNVCLPILRQLRRGSSGPDVSLLQNFLNSQGVYSGPITGYFGPLTEAAVQVWQQQAGIVAGGTPVTTGWGVIGPRTRLILRSICGPADDLSAAPREGDAPLAVTFTIAMDSVPANSAFSLAYGDGASDSVTPIAGTTTVSHTYSANGAYLSSLVATDLTSGATTTLGRGSVYVGPVTAAKKPVIVRLIAPSLLNMGQKGTWKITSSIPSGDTTFSVVWGDENVLTNGSAPASTTNRTGVFKHAYMTAGTFTPRFTATNAQGSTDVAFPVLVFDPNAGQGQGN